jgi:putative transposase
VTFQFIRDHREHFPVRLMCRVLEASPSGFYDWLGRPESQRAAEDRALIEKIQATRADGQPEGYRIGRKRVARLMRENDIRPRTKRKFKVTTDSRHDHPIAPNLLDRQFTVAAPNTVWLADLSYPAKAGCPWPSCSTSSPVRWLAGRWTSRCRRS